MVLSFATIPAALERLAEMVATGPVAVEMLDRMILDLAAENPLYSHYLNFAEGRPAAVLAAQFYADSQDELAARADDLARRFEGRPGVLGVRKSLTNAARDDFWKVRKAGFSLLMAMVGDAKPIAFVEDTAVEPGPAAGVLRPLRGDRAASRGDVPPATATPTSAACTSGRSSTSRRPRAWRRCGRSPGRCRDLVIEFGGSMSGEHGDGLARSVWNRKLFGPEVYAALVRVKTAFDPQGRLNPDKVIGDRRPRRPPADRPRLPPARAGRDHLRLLRPGGLCARRRDVHGRRRLPEDRRRHHVPELHGHPRRDAFDPRPGQRPPPGHERRSPGQPAAAWPTRRSSRRSTSASSARPARANARRRSTWPSSRPSSSTVTMEPARAP